MAALILVNCSCGIKVKEENFYTDVSPDGAIISHFFSPNTQVIGQALWESMREGMVCMEPTSFGDIKIEFEELCSKTPCDQETQAVAHDFFRRMDIIGKLVKQRKMSR